MSVKADVKHNNDGSYDLVLEGGNSRKVTKSPTPNGVVYNVPKDVFDAISKAMSGSKPAEEKAKRGRKPKEEVEEVTTEANEALKEL